MPSTSVPPSDKNDTQASTGLVEHQPASSLSTSPPANPEASSSDPAPEPSEENTQDVVNPSVDAAQDQVVDVGVREPPFPTNHSVGSKWLQIGFPVLTDPMQIAGDEVDSTLGDDL